MVGPNLPQTREHDAGLFVIHGAGVHAPISSLHEIVNPTLNRLREEGNLVSASSISVGDDGIKGGKYDGLVVEYTTKPNLSGPLPAETDVRKLLVVEGYWDRSFALPNIKEVSPWSGRHVSRMAYEIFIYHVRSLGAFIAAVAVLTLIALATWKSKTETSSTVLALCAFFVAFFAALVEVVLSWKDSEAELKRVSRFRYVWALAPAVTLMIYHVQRGLVMVITACAIVLLPIVTALTRLVAMVPGLDWLARGIISSVETALLVGAPTDVATISNNPVGSAGIQSRLREGLAQLEARVKAGKTITIVAHSAGTPLAWWLLSEPGIQKRVRSTKTKDRFRYRLITVGAALNWAKRGMDCTATDLDRPLVRSDEEVVAREDGGNDGSNEKPPADRMVWINPHATWDPVSHGPVWPSEYAGTWGTRDDLEGAAVPASNPVEPERVGVIGRLGLLLFGLVGVILWVPAFVLFSAISLALPLFRRLALAPSGEPPPGDRPDPNVFTRSLGSPISAEHSEYFRNQQEVIPLIVTSIDGDIGWARHDASRERRIRWANARSAMLSALVRVRIIVFALPLFAVGAGLAGNPLITACPANADTPDGRTGTTWQRHFGDDVPNTLHDAIDDVPVFDDLTDNVCDGPWMEDLTVIVAAALIAFGLVETYTEFLWQSLGRRVRTLDRRRLKELDPKRDIAKWRQPSTWRAGYIPFLPALAVWLPTILAPLLILPFNTFQTGFWLLFAVNAALVPFEAFWLDRCLRGVSEPERYPETAIPYGRLYDEKRRLTAGH